jgi:hypothetical protein
MAFSSPVWEVKTTGDDTNNGGGFNTGSTFATDGAATSGTTSSPVFTSASYNFVAADVGHFLFIKTGTNWLPGWYKITAVASNAATIDASPNHVMQYSGTGGAGMGLLQSTGCVNSSYVSGTASATWGVDYSQKSDGSTIISFTDMVIQATTTQFKSTANPVGKNFVGNIISVTAGTGFTVQRVAITSTSGTTATCDKSLGTAGSTGGTGRMGGALKSLGCAGSTITSGQGAIFINSGSYTVTSATVNVAGGCFSVSGTFVARIEGYATWRGDMGTAPVLTASGINTFTFIAQTGNNGQRLANITLDGASATASVGINYAGAIGRKITIKNCKGGAFTGVSFPIYINCVATGCATTAAWNHSASATLSALIGCAAYSNSFDGFTQVVMAVFTIAANNTGIGFTIPVNGGICINCTAYGNTGDGFVGSVGGSSQFFSCVAEANGGFGWNTTSTQKLEGFQCADYNNTSGGFSPTDVNYVFNQIAYTATAFTNGAANDLSLNRTAAGGMLLRGTGHWGAYQSISSTGSIDVGAAQAPWATTTYGEQAHVFIQ